MEGELSVEENHETIRNKVTQPIKNRPKSFGRNQVIKQKKRKHKKTRLEKSQTSEVNQNTKSNYNVEQTKKPTFLQYNN